MKILFTTLAMILTFAGYVPYILDTIKGKTKPHVFGWFVGGVTAFAIYGFQVYNNAGPGSLVTLFVGFLSVFVLSLGLKQGDKNIKKIDVLFLVLALGSLVLWFFTKDARLSTIILVSVGMLGFVPTFRKSWVDPYSETLLMYSVNIVRHFLTIMALSSYTLVTYLNPLAWVIANSIFVWMLVLRRKNFPMKIKS